MIHQAMLPLRSWCLETFFGGMESAVKSWLCHSSLILGGVQGLPVIIPAKINILPGSILTSPPSQPPNPRPRLVILSPSSSQERNLKKVGEEPTVPVVPVTPDSGILSGSLEDATQAGDGMWCLWLVGCFHELYMQIGMYMCMCVYIYTL